MFKKSITFKLTASLVIIMTISLLTIGIIFIQMFRQYAFESKEQTMLTRAQSIAEVIAENSQSFGQIRGLAGTMRFLDTMADAKVWITDSKGNLSTPLGTGSGMGPKFGFGKGAGRTPAYNSEPLPPDAQKVIQEVLKGKQSVSESFSSVYNEATLTAGVPIVDSSHQVIGTVLLHTPVTGVTATLNKAVAILAISLLAALLLVIALGIVYSLFFTRPLKMMNAAALEMTQGNYSVRTGIKHSDEVGQLGNSLDYLALKLGNTINQLFQEKGKLNDIISSISEGLVAFDIALKPISINSALAEIMNRSQPYPVEAAEKDLSQLEINHQLIQVMEEKKSSQLTKDWLGKKLKFTFSPIIDNLGAVTGSVALVQDISESERLEQLRRDFVANVSHEFRTPLTVIRGSVEAVLDGTVSSQEDIERYHHRILSETNGLERLVGDLLELSRLQSGKISINKETIHIPSLLEDIIKSMQTLANQKDIKIHHQPETNSPPFLGDYDRLRQLFVIFLDNAIKYSPSDTSITVASRAIESNTLAVTICDQGYGIAANELPYIWDRFYKADKSRKTTGTGLGLPIAKHLIELHNGSVSVLSEINKGTEIEVRFPIEKQQILER